jgi:hypothetical protein
MLRPDQLVSSAAWALLRLTHEPRDSAAQPTTKRVLLLVALFLAAVLAALGLADAFGFGLETAEGRPPPGPTGGNG